MPPTIKVKAKDEAVKNQRETVARRVIGEFGNSLPDRNLLCLFDDEDWDALKAERGPSNRGVFTPVIAGDPAWDVAPRYVLEELFQGCRSAFESLVYPHGSTCLSDVGLAMTFAHELQHYVQWAASPRLWAAGTLASQLLGAIPLPEIRGWGIASWCDVPHEREARLIAKRTVEALFGVDEVEKYIDFRIGERVTEQDSDDWKCVKGLDTSTPYDLAKETKLLFPRLRDRGAFLHLFLSQGRAFGSLTPSDLDELLRGTGVGRVRPTGN